MWLFGDPRKFDGLFSNWMLGHHPHQHRNHLQHNARDFHLLLPLHWPPVLRIRPFIHPCVSFTHLVAFLFLLFSADPVDYRTDSTLEPCGSRCSWSSWTCSCPATPSSLQWFLSFLCSLFLCATLSSFRTMTARWTYWYFLFIFLF